MERPLSDGVHDVVHANGHQDGDHHDPRQSLKGTGSPRTEQPSNQRRHPTSVPSRTLPAWVMMARMTAILQPQFNRR